MKRLRLGFFERNSRESLGSIHQHARVADRMQKLVNLGFVGLLGLAQPATASSQEAEVIFSHMSFTDTTDIVHVEGTLTGRGIGYKNNHVILTCYKDTRKCLVTSLESEGLVLFASGLPAIVPVREWSSERIIADLYSPCGPPPSDKLKPHWQTTASTTWILDRSRQTAEIVMHECVTAKTHHWTVEDPQF